MRKGGGRLACEYRSQKTVVSNRLRGRILRLRPLTGFTLPALPQISTITIVVVVNQHSVLMNVALPILPPRDYPVTRFASSPLPRFLRTVTFLLSLLLGSSAIGAYIYTKIILPRLIQSRQARDLLLQTHLSYLNSLQASLNKYLDVGFVRKPPPSTTSNDQLSLDGSEENLEITSAEVSTPRLLISSTEKATENEVTSTEVALIEASKEKTESGLILGLSTQKEPVGLPVDDLGNLYSLLPMLAPKERPAGLLRAVKGAGASIVSQSLLFNSKTTRVSTNGSYSLSNQLERAGAVGSGGAWGGGLGPGERDVISLIGGLRGDVRGFKGALLSRRALSTPRPASPFPGPANSARVTSPVPSTT